MQQQTRKLALTAILIALALIFSYIEILIPFNFGVPGIKLGLANLVVIVALYTIGYSCAFTVNCLRILLAAFLFGNFSMAIYSLAGALLSFAVMCLLKWTKQFSIVGVSMAGGVFHNIGQVVVAAMVVENLKLLVYLPVLLIAGIITGTLIGIISYKLIQSPIINKL